jgi:hypothetical protein
VNPHGWSPVTPKFGPFVWKIPLENLLTTSIGGSIQIIFNIYFQSHLGEFGGKTPVKYTVGGFI